MDDLRRTLNILERKVAKLDMRKSCRFLCREKYGNFLEKLKLISNMNPRKRENKKEAIINTENLK